MGNADKKTFIYKTEHHTVVTWYESKAGEVMAQNTTIIERIAGPGDPPPSFCRFMGHGSADIETVLGPRQVQYTIPVPKATTLQEAADGLKEADEAVRPDVVKEAKDEAMEQYRALQSQIAVPGGPTPPPGGPQGLVFPGS